MVEVIETNNIFYVFFSFISQLKYLIGPSPPTNQKLGKS